MVADIGLIGLPSAGKSTLISVISNARPKIAAYHFTTLSPNLGVVNMGKFGGSSNEGFLVADIPGLIEGASEGKGLGHQFLKHIARTKILVHIIDGSLENISEDYKTINKELKDFDKKLGAKDQIIVINKIDLLDEDSIKEKVKELKKISKKTKIFQISGITRVGLKELLFEIQKILEKFKKDEVKEEKIVQPQIPILKPHLDRENFRIEKIIKKNDRKVFRISGKRIEQLIIMTDLKNREGLERIYRYIEKIGIRKAIDKKEAQFGDIIRVKGKDIPYRK